MNTRGTKHEARCTFPEARGTKHEARCTFPEARGTKHEARILVATLMAACSSIAFAMPTQQELKKVQPMVAELMAPTMDDFKAKKKTAAEVADMAVKYAGKAETEAAKFMLYRSSIPYYVRGEAYDKAADAVELMKANVKDVPASVIEEIISKATVRATAKKAPRLFELYRQAKAQSVAEKDVAAFRAKLRKNPGSLPTLRNLAEALATSGDWDAALKEFAKLKDGAAQIAKKELDGSAKSVELGEFWWSYKPTYENADDTFEMHAAVHYRKALAAGEITGLKKNIVEQRIAKYGVTEGSTASVLATTPSAGSIELKTGGNSPFTVKGNEATMDLKNGVKFEFVKCPAGKYKMGFTESKSCLKYHSVTISRPFWIAKLPMTYKLLDGILGKMKRNDGEKSQPAFKLDVLGGDNTPAAITYNQALDVLKRLNQECQAHLPGGYVLRMPSEAEYEYAAKSGRSEYNVKTDGAGEITLFHDRLRALHDRGFDAVKWDHCPWRVPYFAVGSKKPNNWGLYDMFTAGWAYTLDSVNCKRETDTEALTPCYVDDSVDPVQIESGDGKLLLGVVAGCGWGYYDAKYQGRSWVKFLIERGDARHDDCFLRLVIGPDLVSEWKAKNGKK